MKNINMLLKNKKGVGGLRRFIVGVLFFVAFSFLIVTFISSFLGQTNPSSDVLQSKYGLNSSAAALTSSMNNFTSTVNKTSSILTTSNPSTVEYLFLIFQGAFDIPKALLQFVGSGLSALGSMVLGMNGSTGIFSFIVGLALALALLMGVLLIVKAIRTGETEY